MTVDSDGCISGDPVHYSDHMRRSSRTRRVAPVVAGALILTVVVTVLAIRATNHSLPFTPISTPNTSPPLPRATSAAVGQGQMVSMAQYPIPPNLVVLGNMSPGPDHSLWSIGSDARNVFIVKVTTSGTFDEHAIPGALGHKNVYAITAGPDGNVWFTETGAVVRMTPSGAFTAYAIAPSNSEPFGITAGPDSNLWVTDRAANQVLKVTTSGVVSAYRVPTPGSEPGPITAGADGNLWFTEYRAGRVARISTSGTITEFQVPSISGYGGWLPIGIAAGPDGNVWMSASLSCCGGAGPLQGGAVVKITPWGRFATYAVPKAKLVVGQELMREPSPRQITVGSDGKLWFDVINNLDSVTTSGAFSQYVISVTEQVADLDGLAQGPDGNIWFTASCLCNPQRSIVGMLAIT